MQKIQSALAKSECPLLLFIDDKKETAKDARIVARYYKEPNSGLGFVTNVANPKALTEVGSAQEPNPELTNEVTVNELTQLDRMKDSEGNIAYVDPELAFDLASGEEFYSPLTGNKITLAFANDEEEDDSTESESDEEEEDDTSDEDNSEDDSNGEESEDSDEDDSSEEDEDSEDVDMSDLDAEDDSESEEDEDESEEESEEEEEESEEEDASEDNKPEEVVQEAVEVSMLDVADTSKSLQVISTGNGSEYAVFVGDMFVGKLKQVDAVETAAFLYRDGHKLYRTFKDRWMHCAKAGKFDELASLGFVPAKVNVNINELTLRTIAQMVAEKVEQASTEQASYKERTNKVLSLAMVGIAKGVFVRENPLTTEIASVLRRSGIQNAEAQARKILAKSAPGFASAVIEQANELEQQSDAYLNGVSETVSKADFKSTEEQTSDIGQLTTSFGGAPALDEKKEVASFVPSKDGQPKGNKYAGILRKYPI